MKRYLILSADERTWKFDRPVIFLGEWCRRYDRKHIWSKMDAVVAKPYGLTISERIKDYASLLEFKNQIYPEIFNILNRVHNANYSHRFWRILTGDWLVRYVDVIYNRVKTLQQCLMNYEISGVSLISNQDYVLAPPDSLSSVLSLDDDYWNGILYEKIVHLNKNNEFIIEYIIDSRKNKFEINEGVDKYFVKKNFIKYFVLKTYNYVAKFLRNEHDALIINSYLPRMEEMKLHLVLGQLPQLWTLNKLVQEVKYDWGFRKNIKIKTSYFGEPLLNFAFEELLIKLMPIVYLEGFKNLSDRVDALSWPEKPKFIFTSNNHDVDDIFKLYASKKVECLCSPYYIGVHGGGYFSYYDNPGNFELVSDKCLTWGFKHGLPQHIPTFIFTTTGMKGKYDKRGGLLLIQMPRYNRDRTWDVYVEMQNYFDKLTKFVKKLDEGPKDNLHIRVHPFAENLGWCEQEKWMEFDSEIKIDNGKVRLKSMISRSRLVIHGYDSTGLPETLSLNIPTLAILQIGFDQLNELSKPCYQVLVDAGIVHLTSESAAAKVNEVWSNVERWWARSVIQEARKQFCDQYARVSHSPARELKNILLNGIL
jgi:putative transferase (TIGR04331 family)